MDRFERNSSEASSVRWNKPRSSSQPNRIQKPAITNRVEIVPGRSKSENPRQNPIHYRPKPQKRAPPSGQIVNRQDVVDPLQRGRNVRRTDTIRSGFERGIGTIRKSGRNVKRKAITARKSIRYAASRPIIPYATMQGRHSGPLQHGYGNRVHQIHENAAFIEDSPVDVTDDINQDITIDAYQTFLRESNGPRVGSWQDKILKSLLPTRKERKKFYETYGTLFGCYPPPLGMVLLVILQIAMFCFYQFRPGRIADNESIVQDTMDSIFIYDPEKRDEVWRFLTYAVLHKDYEHLIGNVCVGLIVGFLLELVYKWRIWFIYLLGIISGSLGSSIIEPRIKLIGSSGGSYALIGAYVIMFFRRFREFPRPLRIFNGILATSLIVFIGVDFGLAYQRRWQPGGGQVSHVAHIAGLMTGWTVGYAALWSWTTKMGRADILPYIGLAISLIIYLFFVIGAILYNLFASPAGTINM